jgi:hypothetical protein
LGIVSFFVVVPTQLAYQLVRPSVAFNFFQVRLRLYLVQIFMQFIQEKVQKLLTILLVIPTELRVLLNYLKSVSRLQSLPIGRVKIFHQLAEGTGQLALASQHIEHIQMVDVFVAHKIPAQSLDPHHALQGSVQIASVSYIFQPHLTVL